MPDPDDYNIGIIEEFRANGGRVGGYFDGATLLILHTKGIKSGQPREKPLVYLPDGERFVVFGTKGGAPTDPFWVRNVLADPEAAVGNAVIDALWHLGVRDITLPITSETVWRALREARAGPQCPGRGGDA